MRAYRLWLFLLLGLIFVSFSGMVYGSEIRDVRLGIHRNFRRLVFDLDAKPSWNIKANRRSVLITFKGMDASPKLQAAKFRDRILEKYKVYRKKGLVRVEVFTRVDFYVKTLVVPNPYRLVVDFYPKVAGKNKNVIANVTKVQKKKPATVVRKTKPAKPSKKVVPKVSKTVTKEKGISIKGISLPTAPSKVQVVNLPLLPTDRDVWGRKIFNTFLFYFSVDPAWVVRKGSFINLVISHSSLSLNRISSLTVYLNGLPLKSLFLDKSNELKTTVTIPLPLKYVKKGYNEIAVKAYLRSLADPCQDVDNPGNWLKIHHESVIHIEYTLRKDLLLSDYPVPFFEPISPKYFRTVVVVPDKLSGRELSAAFSLIMDWAQNSPYGGFFPIVSTESELTSRDKEDKNLVYIGRFNGFSVSFKRYVSSKVDMNLRVGKSYLVVMRSPFTDKRMMLLITGYDDLDVLRGAKAIIIPTIRKQMTGKVAMIDRSVVLPMKSNYKVLGDFITISELGYPNILLEGMYHQEKLVTYMVPTNWKLKKGAYAKIYFRHSKVLSPDRSSLTIMLNDVPITSVKLTKENADNGEVTVKLPDEILKGGTLNFGFRAYLDINTKDCAKNYVEDAWVLIKGTSLFYLPHTILPAKFLIEYMPYLYMGKEGLKDTDVVFTDKPDRATMSVLANILASWQDRITLPMPPNVHIVKNERSSVFKKRTKMIVVGRAKAYMHKLFPKLISYDARKNRFYSEKYPLVPKFVRDATVIQVINNGGYPLTWIVVPRNLKLTPVYLLSLDGRSTTDIPVGELSLISQTGKVVSFVEKKKKKQKKEQNIVSRVLEAAAERRMLTTLLIFLTAAAIIVVIILRRERKR